MIVDTSALLAYFDQAEAQHAAVSAVIDAAEQCVVSPYVLAELDYLVTSHYGREAELAILQELLDSDWELAHVSNDDLAEIRDVLASYGEAVGLADAANLVLARRYRHQTIATLDRRHFSYLHLPGHPPLTVVP